MMAPDETTAYDVGEQPPFARISDYADELGRIAGYIQDFLDRCRGTDNGAKAMPTPVPSGHVGQLDRLGDNLHRVDCLARELQRLG
jgi:hypothetical protein